MGSRILPRGILVCFILDKPLTPKTMGKYLKQGFVRELEWQLNREEISYSKMVNLMEEECIKNYKKTELEDGGHEIYEMIRNTFHSKSGYFLTKSEAYDVMKVVKDIVETRPNE
tara:strand:- start:169 stop:510 length:342 start_codon:yes stop_codon:yes gene_type:complete